MKKALPIIFVTVIVILLFFFLGGGSQKYNWRQSYHTSDDNPFGCKLTLEMLPDIFTKNIVELDSKTIVESEGYELYQLDEIAKNRWESDDIYTTDEDNYDDYIDDYSDESKNSNIVDNGSHNYIIINQHFYPGSFEAKALLYHVKQGNDVFLAAEYIHEIVKNELKFGLSDFKNTSDDSTTINFSTGYRGDQINYKFDISTAANFINFFDDESSEVIAVNERNNPVLLKIKYGNGNIFICTIPIAFTNYHIIHKYNNEFASIALSQLSNKNINFISTRAYLKKNNDLQESESDNNQFFDLDQKESKLELLKENPPLWWAFIMTIIVGVAFFLFGAKRKQRIIPVVRPPQNSTIAFVKIIADLYFQKGDHKNIAMKKINYFLEYVRSSFFVKTNQFDEELYAKISERSDVQYETVETVFETITSIKNKRQLTQTELLEISNLLERFKNESKI